MKTAIPWIISAFLAVLLFLSNRPREISAEELSSDFADFYARPNEKIYEIHSYEEFSILKTKFDRFIALSVEGNLLGLISPDGGSIQLFRNGHLDVWYPGPQAKPNTIQVFPEGMEPRRWHLLIKKNEPPKLEEIP